MRTTKSLASAVVMLTLAGCPAGSSGDDVPGDDGETSGDGDGDRDDECSCENSGSFEQCGVSEPPLLVHSTLSWPAGVDLELDEVCVVTANSVEATVELDCPTGLVTITLELEPAWAPGFGAGEQLRLRASESLGMSEGSEWQYLRWRLDRADDSQLLVSYLNSETLNSIDDPFTSEIAVDLCPRICDGELVIEPVGLRMTNDEVALLLFSGQTGDLGGYVVQVGQAQRHLCTDVGPGRYAVAITAKL